MTFFTGLNLLASFVNQAVLAYFFGAGPSMDAFLISGALPFAVLNLAIGDLGYALVPLLIQCQKEGDERRACDSSFTAISLVALGVTAIGTLGHRWILRLTTSANTPSQTFELSALIAPTMWVIVGLTILGSFLTGIHHYRRSFTYPAMTLVLPYLGMIGGGLLGASRYGILSVAAGWAVATGLRNISLYLLLPSPRVQFVRSPNHPAVIRLYKSTSMLGISLLPFTVLPVIDTFWASRLPVGSISYIGYSSRIIIAVGGIVVQGLCVVLFTDLSHDIANQNLDKFRRKLVGASHAIILSIVPLAMLVMMLRSILVSALLQRGHFAPSVTLGVIRVLPFYLLGMIFMAPMTIVIRAFYALGDYATPARLGLGLLAVYIVASGLLVRHFSYVGIGIAYAIFWFLTLVVQTYALERKVGRRFGLELFSFLGKVTFSCFLVGYTAESIAKPLESTLGRYVGPTCAIAVGLAILGVITHRALGDPQVKMLVSLVRQR